MSKYIDSEKLIAEIDSILSACTKQTHTGVYNTCHRIKGIVASLQQEQPEVDLEKEIEKQIRSIFYDLDGIAIMGTSKYASVDDMEYVARHFFELGRARKED